MNQQNSDSKYFENVTQRNVDCASVLETNSKHPESGSTKGKYIFVLQIRNEDPMVTQYLTIPKNIQSRLIRAQQKLFTLENCTSKTL